MKVSSCSMSGSNRLSMNAVVVIIVSFEQFCRKGEFMTPKELSKLSKQNDLLRPNINALLTAIQAAIEVILRRFCSYAMFDCC